MENNHEIRKKIGIDKLDESSRKELFKKFIDHGGQVKENIQPKKSMIIARKAQQEYLKKQNLKHKSYTSQKPIVKKKTKKNKDTFETRLYKFFNSIRLFWLGYLNSVFKFDGTTLTDKFIQQWDENFKNAIYELQLFVFDCFFRDPDKARWLKSELTKKNKFYPSIIENYGKIYDEDIFNEISNSLKVKNCNIKNIAPLITPVFKRLYVLYRYYVTAFTAFNKASELTIYREPENKNILKKRIKSIKSALDFVFNKFFLKIFILLQRNWKEYPDLYTKELNLLLNMEKKDFILKSNKINIYKPDEPEEDKSKEKSSDEKKKKEETPIYPKLESSIAKGLLIFEEVDSNYWRNKIDKLGQLSYISDRDKILKAYILFQEFDQEYSFIMNTNKINFNIDYSQGKRIDVKSRLNDIYYHSNECIEIFKRYIDIMKQLKKERTSSFSDPNIKYKNITRIEKIRINEGSAFRMRLKKIMKELADNLNYIIEDNENNRKILEKPDDIISFDNEIEKIKRINNKKAIDIIKEAYDYTHALAYRLSEEGDLFGGILEQSDDDILYYKNLIEEQKKYIQEDKLNKDNSKQEDEIVTQIKENQDTDENIKNKKETENNKKDNIFSDLDSFLN